MTLRFSLESLSEDESGLCFVLFLLLRNIEYSMFVTSAVASCGLIALSYHTHDDEHIN